MAPFKAWSDELVRVLQHQTGHDFVEVPAKSLKRNKKKMETSQSSFSWTIICSNAGCHPSLPGNDNRMRSSWMPTRTLAATMARSLLKLKETWWPGEKSTVVLMEFDEICGCLWGLRCTLVGIIFFVIETDHLPTAPGYWEVHRPNLRTWRVLSSWCCNFGWLRRIWCSQSCRIKTSPTPPYAPRPGSMSSRCILIQYF